MSKIIAVCCIALCTLLLVANFPLMSFGGRGIAGKGIFVFINEGTFDGLVIFSLLFTSIFSWILKIPVLVIFLLSSALTLINLSILLLDARASHYNEYIEAIILGNYGNAQFFNFMGYSFFVVGCILLLVSIFMILSKGRYTEVAS